MTAPSSRSPPGRPHLSRLLPLSRLSLISSPLSLSHPRPTPPTHPVAAASSSRPHLTPPPSHSLPRTACSSPTLLPPTRSRARGRGEIQIRGRQTRPLPPPSSPRRAASGAALTPVLSPFLLSWGKEFEAYNEAVVEAPALRWRRCPFPLLVDAPPLDVGLSHGAAGQQPGSNAEGYLGHRPILLSFRPAIRRWVYSPAAVAEWRRR